MQIRSCTAELVTAGRSELVGNPMMSVLDQPGVGPHLAPGSPLAFAGHDRDVDLV